jgi:DNA-binding NarL/FixJ family response regulator
MLAPQHAKRMKAIELTSEKVTVAPKASEFELNSVGVYQNPLTQSRGVPLCRLATQLTALRSKLAQPRKKIYIVQDHPAFGEGLTQILNDAGDLTVCGTASAVHQALPAIARAKPDLVLVDINLTGKGGLELIKALRSVDRPVKLLAISEHKEAPHAARVLRSGGDGYMVKQEDPDEIVNAIHDVLEGHIYVSEEVMESTRGGGRSRSFRRENSPARSSNGSRA